MVGSLKGVGFHRRANKLPEVTAEGDARRNPIALQRLHTFGEANDKASRINLKGEEYSVTPASANLDLDVPTTELIQDADTLGEVNGQGCTID
jgi:hypothetical protein